MKRNGDNSGMQRSAGQALPFNGLMNGVLSRFFDDDFLGYDGRRSIPVNIRETDKSYELELVAPGLRKEDFRIQLDDKTLTISFEHKEEERNESEKNYLRQEYRMQSFSRSFNIDDSMVDAAKISARYENGVLWLSLPKKEGAQRQRRQIDIA
ncbi:Hsp20/alpha crystallin family protein [Flaviaesturariibacter aridisoli]|nr:Hsp20/alpha crystallin family protein [Flaviaesturariibacter aridisoli]